MNIEDTLRLILREELQRANRELITGLERLSTPALPTNSATAIVDNRWLSTQQAAELAGVHPETVREALRGRELHGIQQGKSSRWKTQPECVDAWLAGAPCPHLTPAQPPISLASRRNPPPPR